MVPGDVVKHDTWSIKHSHQEYVIQMKNTVDEWIYHRLESKIEVSSLLWIAFVNIQY